ncbi:MAG TPA: hypothetical protein ENK44_14015 [Caldithrix abyssi]|uniref:HEAT repeat domain-containing protein n=1 Tax=Caldithrix abyssi TaxID=187145 RepID=A0A7V4U355_CALAY|nr:hypothetical protein [Caldithrix abyssi]
MRSLQDLYDYYLATKPSRGKVKSATTLLIHICKALRVNSPEDVDSAMYHRIPQALDELFYSARHKSIQDKSILAEMIGRYGPKDGWDEAFDILLDDHDENLRQFTLYALQYIGRSEAELVLPYINRYRKSSDPLMKNVSANLAGKILCSDGADVLKRSLRRWAEEGDMDYIEEIALSLTKFMGRSNPLEDKQRCDVALSWLKGQFNLKEK